MGWWFAVYLAVLVWLVVWKLGAPGVGGGPRQPPKLVPFVASGVAGASAPLEVAANVLLFVPFGAYLGLLVPGWRWWRVVTLAGGASLLLEVTQYVLVVGSADVSDVLANAAGALVGLGLVDLARRHGRPRSARGLARACAAGTAVAVLALALLAASSLRYGPARHVPPGDGHRAAPAMMSG
ncbi:MAG: VanZ family protein [Micrococcales bacterium]|nr:VanZ family protein [Micrococcales bacterium]